MTASATDTVLPPELPPTPTPGGGNEPPQAAKPLFEETTLAELGPNLPVGIVVGDKRVRPFRVRPFRLKEERALAELREKSKSQTIGHWVADVLGMMMQTVGPHSFDAMKDHDRHLIISMMTVPDVLYMYVYLRYDALGPNEPLSANLVCPKCSSKFEFMCDLGTLVVRKVPDDRLDLTRQYDLRDGFPHKGKLRKAVELDVLKWNLLERKEFAANAGKRQTMTVIGSIVGVEGETHKPIVLPESDLDEMTKYDYEGISRDIEVNTPGAQFAVDAVCVTCAHEFKHAINWVDFQGFFSRSSQRLPGRS